MNDLVERLARQASLTANVVWVLVALALTLAAGSAVRWAVSSARPFRRRSAGAPRQPGHLVGPVRLAGPDRGAGGGRGGGRVRGDQPARPREFRALTRDWIAPVRLWWRLAYLAVPVHYLLIHLGWLDGFRTFFPVWVFGILLVRLVVAGQTGGFLETAGITFLGLMLIVFLFSHAVLLLRSAGRT